MQAVSARRTKWHRAWRPPSIISTLLLWGGVEQNPGPPQVDTAAIISAVTSAIKGLLAADARLVAAETAGDPIQVQQAWLEFGPAAEALDVAAAEYERSCPERPARVLAKAKTVCERRLRSEWPVLLHNWTTNKIHAVTFEGRQTFGDVSGSFPAGWLPCRVIVQRLSRRREVTTAETALYPGDWFHCFPMGGAPLHS